ncbi:MAG: hypothetical protein RLZZ597_942, partial [Cyanobacteriota bacterium]
MKILVLNAGSSSHKSCLFHLTQVSNPSLAPSPIWRAALDWTHAEGQVELSAETESGARLKQSLPITDKAEGIAAMLKTLVEGETQVLASLGDIDGVGHRVVHGGRDYVDSVRIDSDVKAAI